MEQIGHTKNTNKFTSLKTAKMKHEEFKLEKFKLIQIPIGQKEGSLNSKYLAREVILNK
ncbi:hypothetical protein D3C72_1385240 [compost metagenome]